MARHPIGDEFGLIERHFAPIARNFPGALELADDAALIDLDPGHQLVATTDALIADVHFFADDPPDLIARKLLRVNLSDLAAMGAEPRAYLLALALPKDTDEAWLAAFAEGLAVDSQGFGIALAGGDTVATGGPLSLALTALGQVAAGCALMRSGAKAGDGVYVSGTIGDGALGLMALKGDLEIAAPHREQVIERYRLPQPRLSLGRRLVGVAHAAIDVSDGLIADLGHICRASGIGVTIAAAAVPLSDAAREAAAGDGALLARLLSGGDDYELAFTAPPEMDGAIATLGEELELPVCAIGQVGPGEGVVVGDSDELGLVFDGGGYRHF